MQRRPACPRPFTRVAHAPNDGRLPPRGGRVPKPTEATASSRDATDGRRNCTVDSQDHALLPPPPRSVQSSHCSEHYYSPQSGAVVTDAKSHTCYTFRTMSACYRGLGTSIMLKL